MPLISVVKRRLLDFEPSEIFEVQDPEGDPFWGPYLHPSQMPGPFKIPPVGHTIPLFDVPLLPQEFQFGEDPHLEILADLALQRSIPQHPLQHKVLCSSQSLKLIHP